MSDITCPYCSAEIDICHDDGYGYEEDRIHQQECGKCRHTFTFTTSISFTYEPKAAACLNGGDHKYYRTKTHPVRFSKLICEMCGEEKPK